MKKILFIIIFIINTKSFSQDKLAPEKLIKDIDFLIDKYEEIHPNLYAYSSKVYFKNEIYTLKKGITDSLTSIDFWMRLAPMINELKDGHTSINPNDKDLGVYLEKFNSSEMRFLPLSVFILDSTIYVREIYGNDSVSIQASLKVKSINGHSDIEILQKLIGYKNGERADYRMHCVQQTFLWDYSLFFPSIDYEIEYYENGLQKRKKLKGITDKQTEKYNEIIFPRLPDYRYKLIDKNIGLIEYNSCTDIDKFKLFLDSTFTKIIDQKIGNLIIDIRRNSGGNSDLNNLLLTYLYGKQFYSYSTIKVKVTEDIRNLNEMYAQFKNDTIITIDTYQANKPTNKLLFKGNVYLLTSVQTFSSGTHCAMLFKDYDIGIIVGQATGGIPTGYGDKYSFKLPFSGLKANVSYKYFIRPSGEDDRKGVLPDILIKPSIDDFFNNKDLEIDHVLKLIRNE